MTVIENRRQGAGDLVPDVHTDDSLAYARTIWRGLERREAEVLAAVYENMPCSVKGLARVLDTSPRTVRRALEALEGDHLLVQRVEGGLIVHPDAIGAIDAWAQMYSRTPFVADWWKVEEDPNDWPDDVFPPPEHFPENPAGGENIELAIRAVENRRVPAGTGARIPFSVLDFVSATESLAAAKVALECGRRANSYGVARFERGELTRAAGVTPSSATRALTSMRETGLASTATTTRVELNLRHR